MLLNKASLGVSWCQSKPTISDSHFLGFMGCIYIFISNNRFALTSRNAQIRLIEQHLKIKKRAKRVAITLASLPQAPGLIGPGIGLNLRRDEEK